MGFFSRIKALFSRKKGEKQAAAVAAEETTVEEAKEPAQTQEEAVPEAGRDAPEASEKERFVGREKKCPNCSAPNSPVSSKCWLCKKDIY